MQVIEGRTWNVHENYRGRAALCLYAHYRSQIKSRLECAELQPSL